MGFEHQIHFGLTNELKDEIRKLLTGNSHFAKTITVNNTEFFEFNTTKSDNNIPDFAVVIETNGLYICNNRDPDIPTDIEFITHYLLAKNIKYTIEEL